LINLCCPYGEADETQKIIREKIWSIGIPQTQKTEISHGSYVEYSRYHLKQHEYSGGQGGFIEVLEIINAPEDRANFVVYSHTHGTGAFYEWETLKDALRAFNSYFHDGCREEKFRTMGGFKREVNCDVLVPWFYALGDEELVGDYVFPSNLQRDDPVFRFGRKFIYYERGVPSIKTCLGAYYDRRDEDSRSAKEPEIYRVAVFEDGSIWGEYYEGNRRPYLTEDDNIWLADENRRPQPLRDDELWIADAMEQFRNFLSGNTKKLSISFLDGQKFTGHWGADRTKAYKIAGDYFMHIIIEGETKPLIGWTGEFKPTLEAPNILKFIENKFAEHGKKVLRAEILKIKPIGQKKEQKWSGVFYQHEQSEETSK
jgi:hypothetical protein